VLRWDPAEVEEADALPWDMPFARALRPLTMRTIAQVTLAGVLLVGSANGLGLGVVLTTEAKDEAYTQPTLLVAACSAELVLAVGVLAGLVVFSPRVFRRLFPVGFLVGILSSSLVVALAVYGVGPGFGDISAVYIIEAPLFAFYLCRLPWALLSLGLAIASYGVVLLSQDGWPGPLWRWAIVSAAAGTTSLIMGRIAQRSEELAEVAQRARDELADVNRTLEGRVATQVGEIEKLGGLRRFLSPQVADVLLSDDSETLHRPHRARIAVFFCDLRGFTAFTNRAEPEEVVSALDEYYAVTGGLLLKHGATIGDYAGDGVMAYFGDPVPHPDPAGAALSMAQELRDPMTRLVAEWRRLGHDLGYGVGVAYGYATVGVIGFDGRYDYTPIGGVVNLAARLCAKAGHGEVLLDHAAYAAAEDRVVGEPVELDLKGYAADTRAYRLTSAGG